MPTYSVQNSAVSQILADVRNDRIAIPELQRPFVWNSVKVRDLMDSLYKGYPVGFLITWQSVGAKLKGGDVARHQQILIDGQQRVTALRAAVAGLPVVDKSYKKKRIVIAFNPLTEEFATRTAFIERDPQWIPDISELFSSTSTFSFFNDYFRKNPEADTQRVERNLNALRNIENAPIGIINLNDELDVETVSEIFIRINAKGVALSNADFAMSKIATYGDRGRNIRKLIDYFCHLAVAPHVFDDIAQNDPEFSSTEYFKAISWLHNDSEDLFDPEYGDIIRIAGLSGFGRGKAASIVSTLSGRDPETRKVDEDLIPLAYDTLESTLLQIVNKYNFENFLLAIKSAGYIAPRMITSKNALNFAYALYIRLRRDSSLTDGERKSIVRRWFVMSMLTGRNSGSFETAWELDLRRIDSLGPAEYLAQIEKGELGEDFWQVQLPASFETTSPNSPFFQGFVASQVYRRHRGFLSRSITVAAMHEQSGDIHHIVPKDFLVKNGFPDRRDYNQVANLVIAETPINISISNRPPREYMDIVQNQVSTGELQLGEIVTETDLNTNLVENAIPANLQEVDASNYLDFLDERRSLMAEAIRSYYFDL